MTNRPELAWWLRLLISLVALTLAIYLHVKL